MSRPRDHLDDVFDRYAEDGECEYKEGSMATEPLTVGKLRSDLAEYHESDIVLINDKGLLWRVLVDKDTTDVGTVVLLTAGEPYLGRGQQEGGS